MNKINRATTKTQNRFLPSISKQFCHLKTQNAVTNSKARATGEVFKRRDGDATTLLKLEPSEQLKMNRGTEDIDNFVTVEMIIK
jgi:hypothetical protein